MVFLLRKGAAPGREAGNIRNLSGPKHIITDINLIINKNLRNVPKKEHKSCIKNCFRLFCGSRVLLCVYIPHIKVLRIWNYLLKEALFLMRGSRIFFLIRRFLGVTSRSSSVSI